MWVYYFLIIKCQISKKHRHSTLSFTNNNTCKCCIIIHVHMTVLMKHGEMIHSTISYVKWYPIKMCVKAITLTQFEYSAITMILAPKVFVYLYVVL
jgi:deoxycytidylate deaminase